MLALLIELPGIEDIVPNAVEATGHGRDGREKRVAHPNGKYRVFLTQTLGSCDGFAVFLSPIAAKGELRNTSQQAAHPYP